MLDSTNTAIASINHGPGIDHPLSYRDMINDSTYYYHQDYLGSITGITDESQNVVETYKYDAFGNLLQTSDLSLPLYYAYTGREYDQESGLYFYRARYYDPEVGRFLEVDPIGFLGGLNLYAYVSNNPVNLIDPWGWCPEDERKEKNLGLIAIAGVTAAADGPLPIGDTISVGILGYLGAKAIINLAKKVGKNIFRNFPTRKKAKDARDSVGKLGEKDNRSEKHGKGSKHFHDKNRNNPKKPNVHYRFP